jgi:putative DNA primase/helicase
MYARMTNQMTEAATITCKESVHSPGASHGARKRPNTAPVAYTMHEWLKRDIPQPDPLLGHIFKAGSRTLLAAESGLGKSQIAMAWATAMSLGSDFLHWKAYRPANVLYIDGELPQDILQKRVKLAYGFFGIDVTRPNLPPGPLILSHTDHLDMPPIDTLDGQAWLDREIQEMGRIDFIIFDNLQALSGAGMKDEQGWLPLKPYVRKLASQGIGQLWIHHTGRNTSHAYGTSAREWGMQTVMVAEACGSQEAGPCFTLNFTKATDRDPTNAADFAPMTLTLENGKWSCAEATEDHPTGAPKSVLVALAALQAVRAEHGGKVPWKEWRNRMIKDGITTSEKPGSQDKACQRAREELLKQGRVLDNGDGTYSLEG